MEISGCNQGEAWHYAIAIRRFAQPDPAQIVQPVGEGCREHGPNVLDDHDARAVLRRPDQNFANRFGATKSTRPIPMIADGFGRKRSESIRGQRRRRFSLC